MASLDEDSHAEDKHNLVVEEDNHMNNHEEGSHEEDSRAEDSHTDNHEKSGHEVGMCGDHEVDSHEVDNHEVGSHGHVMNNCHFFGNPGDVIGVEGLDSCW